MFKLNAIIPELAISDINRSLHFYLNVLLFKVDNDQKKDKFALISLESSQILIEEIKWETENLFYPFGRGINFKIIVDSIDNLYKNIKTNNYPIKIEMQESWHRANNKLLAIKEFSIIDPDGYLFKFYQNSEREYEMKEIQTIDILNSDNNLIK